MTREIRYSDKDGHRAPKNIDHGHWGRKTVFWAVFVLMVPVALLHLAILFISNGLEWLGGNLNTLRVWAHPCLYSDRDDTYTTYPPRERGKAHGT